MNFKEERLNPHQFATIKEYLRVGGNYKGISEVTGLAVGQIKEVDQTKFYKDYMRKQDERFVAATLAGEDEVIVIPDALYGKDEV